MSKVSKLLIVELLIATISVVALILIQRHPEVTRIPIIVGFAILCALYVVLSFIDKVKVNNDSEKSQAYEAFTQRLTYFMSAVCAASIALIEGIQFVNKSGMLLTLSVGGTLVCLILLLYYNIKFKKKVKIFLYIRLVVFGVIAVLLYIRFVLDSVIASFQ